MFSVTHVKQCLSLLMYDEQVRVIVTDQRRIYLATEQCSSCRRVVLIANILLV